MEKGLLIIVSLLGLILPLVSAIGDDIPIQIQTTDASGNIITGTFSITVNISNSSNCDSVLYSNISTRTTDSRGIISFKLENVSLGFDEQYYFCYYRDGVLKQNQGSGRVPYAFNSKYLGGYDENFFAPLNTSLNGNFTISGSLFINGIDALNGSSEDTIPLNTIIFYNGTSCPQGFSELSAAQGRYIVGNPSGGTLAATVGTALSDQENRAVGQHTHTFTGDEMGEHIHAQHVQGSVAKRTSGTSPSIANAGAGGTTTNEVTEPNTAGTPTGTNANAGSIAGTNAPYVQYFTCIKTATVDLTQGWNQDASSLYMADSTLKVGIGTSTPSGKLTIVSPDATIQDVFGLWIVNGLTEGGIHEWGLIPGIDELNDEASFQIKDITQGLSRFVIKSDGNVGIGTSTPTQKLEVNGSVNVGGNLTVQGNIGFNIQSETCSEGAACDDDGVNNGSVILIAPAGYFVFRVDSQCQDGNGVEICSTVGSTSTVAFLQCRDTGAVDCGTMSITAWYARFTDIGDS